MQDNSTTKQFTETFSVDLNEDFRPDLMRILLELNKRIQKLEDFISDLPVS